VSQKAPNSTSNSDQFISLLVNEFWKSVDFWQRN